MVVGGQHFDQLSPPPGQLSQLVAPDVARMVIPIPGSPATPRPLANMYPGASFPAPSTGGTVVRRREGIVS
jgi:hypothetical protein